MATPMFKSVTVNAELLAKHTAELENAKRFKTQKRASNFRDGLVITLNPTVSDANWVYDDAKKRSEDEELRLFPVFLTIKDGVAFDHLWLSTLINSSTDNQGDEHVAVGTFNKLVNEVYDSATDDHEVLTKVLERLAGRRLRIDRKHRFNGKYRVQSVLNIDILDADGNIVDANGNRVTHTFQNGRYTD